MKYARKNKVSCLIFTLPVLLRRLTGPVRTLVPGLTSNEVYGTWINTNAALVAVGAAATGDERLTRQLETLRPRNFNGKKPADVYEQPKFFNRKLAQLRIRQGPNMTRSHNLSENRVVTPSVVFRHAGHVLDTIIQMLVHLDRKRLISGYFRRHKIPDQVPDGSLPPHRPGQSKNRRAVEATGSAPCIFYAL